MENRIANAGLASRLMSASAAAALIQPGMTVGKSGFTGAGYPQAVPLALAERRVLQQHMPHLQAPLLAALFLGAALLTSPAVDATVFLTHRQRAEAEAHFGPHDSYHVIPHSVPDAAPGEPVPRDPALVVMMARLDQQKQVDHAIAAFAEVVKALPEARLDIYGRGVLEGRLTGLRRCSVRKGKVTRRWCGSTPIRGASASGRSELRSGVLFMVRLGCRQRVAAS